MGSELPAAPNRAVLAAHAPVQLKLGRDSFWTSNLFSRIPYRAFGQFAGALDYALMTLAAIMAGVAYHSVILQGGTPGLGPYLAAGNLVAALFVFGAASQGVYSPSALASPRRQVRCVLFFWSLAFLSLALFLFLAKFGAELSRGTIIVFALVSLLLLLSFHLWISVTFKSALAQGTIAGDRAVIIGDRDAMASLSPAGILQKAGALEVRRYQLPPLRGSDYANGLRIVEDAINFARSNRMECVLLALAWNDEYRRELICERLQILPIRVLLLPDQHVDSILSRAGQPTREFTVELQRPPLSWGELALKRALDFTLATVLLIALLPLFVVISILIKGESHGPVIFYQRRKGFNGQEFRIFKFRTMTTLEDGQLVSQARRNDPRVTRVGRILRAASIDELPQLLNVLLGQMSLVGPRPHAVAHDERYIKAIANYAFRQRVKPGLTGWAQVNGLRGETSRLELMERRVGCDLWYVKNWSFWLDLRILILTGFEVLRGRNAY